METANKPGNLEERLGEAPLSKEALAEAGVQKRDGLVVRFNKKHYSQIKPLIRDGEQHWVGGKVRYNQERPSDETPSDVIGYESMPVPDYDDN